MDSADHFYKKFTGDSAFSRLSYDGRDNFRSISKALGYEEMDASDFFMQHSIFNAISPFWPYYQQIKTVRIAAGALARTSIKPLFNTLRYCPVCMKEALKRYGMPVWLRSHQVPGVTVCYIHGCRLHEYSGKYGNECDIANGWKTTDSQESMAFSLQYAVTANALLKEQKGITFDDTRTVLSNALNNSEKNSSKDKAETRFLNYKSIRTTPEKCISTITELFRTADDFFSAVPAKKVSGSDYINALLNATEYEFIEPADKKVQRDKKLFSNEVRDLTGSHYQVLSFNHSTNSSAVIRHNDCGTKNRYSVTRFLNGSRCPLCHHKISDTDMKHYITVASGNRYQYFGRDSGNTLLIEDRFKKAIKVMTAELALQELNRPTPSLLLPHDAFTTKASVQNRRERLMKRLSDQYQPNELIFTDDFNGDPELKYITETIKELAKQHKLRHIAYGVYSFPESDIAAIDVIKQKYIARKGKTFGYFTGKSFAYTLGMIKNQPERLTIITSGTPGDYPVTILGTKCNVAKPRVPVNEQNARLLPVLDLFAKFERYHDNSESDALAILQDYIKKQQINEEEFSPYIGLYQPRVLRRISILYGKGNLS